MNPSLINTSILVVLLCVTAGSISIILRAAHKFTDQNNRPSRSVNLGWLLISLLLIIPAIYLIFGSPVQSWDVFGEWGYGGYGDTIKSYADNATSNTTVDVARESARHSQPLFKFSAYMALLFDSDLSWVGVKLLWVVNVIIAGTACFYIAGVGFGLPFLIAAALTVVFFHTPLLFNGVIMTGYYESWLATGLLLSVFFGILFLRSRSISCLLAFSLLLASTSTTKSVGPIFACIIALSLVATELTRVLKDTVLPSSSEFLAEMKLKKFFVASVVLFIPTAVFVKWLQQAPVIDIAGRSVTLNAFTHSIAINESNILFVNQSFSALPLAAFFIVFLMITELRGKAADEPEILFSAIAFMATWCFLVFSQVTDYGNSIAASGSDTGMSRMHIGVFYLLIPPLCLVISRENSYFLRYKRLS